MDELPDELREALEASVRRARVLLAAQRIVDGAAIKYGYAPNAGREVHDHDDED